jgi:uncharacterized protein (TIGR02271 family)
LAESGVLAGGPHLDNATERKRDVAEHSVKVGERVVVPIVSEQLTVEKRTREVGQVAVHIEPRVEQQVLEVPLLEDSVEVKRVAVNKFIEEPVPVREEGDVTIVPVFEEVLVVEKRLMLKEEIHLIRRRVATQQRQTFAVRKEEAHVLHSGTPAAEAAREGTAVAKARTTTDGE